MDPNAADQPLLNQDPKTVPAGCLPPWDVGRLSEPPPISWHPRALLGPGLLMVGAAIGGGEWLMGPAATAKYGGAIMGLATISILCQVAYNLEVMRYTLYCGEPICVGFFRLMPGPRFWTGIYLFVDFFGIWPYLAASAAVPIHAILLGHMPTADDAPITQWLSYGVFLSAFLPLIFGGKIYNSLEKLMLAKVVLVLTYLTTLGIFLVSSDTWLQIFAGFLFIGRDHAGSWGFHVPQPPAGQSVDWALLAGFAAVAGVGGLNNSQLSTYSRDKGWGMGSQVGAVPSMVGGMGIALSHVGKVFPLNADTLRRWHGWLRFVRRDQLVIWAVGCFLGMAIPSLVSLQFLQGVNVPDKDVPAATAHAIIGAYPNLGFLWVTTLLCGFVILAPAQVTTIDGLVRRWTDVLWSGNPRVQKMEGHAVKYVYYGLLGIYAIWGIFILVVVPEALVLTKVTGVFMNLALGFSSFHTLAVNCRLLPKPLRPGWFMRVGLMACGVFFISVAILGFPKAMRDLGFDFNPGW